MNSRYSAHLLVIVVTAFFLLGASPGLTGDNFGELVNHSLKCGVSADSVEQVKSLVSDSLVTEDQAVSLLSPLLKACVEQLPLFPFEDKLAEGISKRVVPLSIVRVLDKRLEAYRFARELLLTSSGRLDQDALVVIGESVEKGVSKNDFESYAMAFEDQSPEIFSTGVTMVALQGQVGFDYALTRTILEHGVKRGVLSTDWRYFVRIILAARKQDVSDKAIANAAVSVILADGAISDVMPELGFTERSLAGELKQ